MACMISTHIVNVSVIVLQVLHYMTLTAGCLFLRLFLVLRPVRYPVFSFKLCCPQISVPFSRRYGSVNSENRPLESPLSNITSWLMGNPLEILDDTYLSENASFVAVSPAKYASSSIDTISACDGRTDRQTDLLYRCAL